MKTLSDKQKDRDWMYNCSNIIQKCYTEEDVKQFIKDLKRKAYSGCNCPKCLGSKVNNLAGEKLI